MASRTPTSSKARTRAAFDEIAVDAINLQPGDEKIVATRLRGELTRR
jgi:hypothetical protein